MLIKLLFPTLSTENINCDSDINMSVDEYSNAIIDNFNQNKDAIDDMFKYGNKNNMIYFNNNQDYKSEIFDSIKFGECEVQITKLNNGPLSLETLNEYAESNRMVILSLNVNPDTVDYDIYTDMKMWINDSTKIHNDNRLTKNEQINALPIKGLKIDVNGIIFNLETCKIIQNNYTPKTPFNFIVLVEKITKKQK